MTPTTGSLPRITRIRALGPHEPRLLRVASGREDLAAYLSAGGYPALPDAEPLLEAVERAGLRGRGGAAFPAATKLGAVRGRALAPVVVANGEEGEPASVKDRWLLRHRPHLVLDGLRIAAAIVGAPDLHVFVSDTAAEASVRAALAELDEPWAAGVTVTRVDPAYVAGEETAVVHALNGGPALPTDKPPRPFEAGVDGRPTLVSNVETLANLPLIVSAGADAYRSAGTATSSGSFLLTLTGCAGAGLFEVAFGSTIRDVLGELGHDSDTVRGAVVGGYFGGIAGAAILDVPLDYTAFASAGAGLGCGAIALLGHEDCPVAVAAGVLAYFAENNAGQCGSCFNGTPAMSAVVTGLREGTATRADVDRLTDWSVRLRGRGACGTLDGATNVAASLLREFPDLVAAHLAGPCEQCARTDVGDAPFAVGLDVDGGAS